MKNSECHSTCWQCVTAKARACDKIASPLEDILEKLAMRRTPGS